MSWNDFTGEQWRKDQRIGGCDVFVNIYLVLSADIPHSEANVLVLDRFDVEPCGNNGMIKTRLIWNRRREGVGNANVTEHVTG